MIATETTGILAGTDLNMDYYIKRFNTDASKICVIILPSGKYFQNMLHIDIAGSQHIFLLKSSNLMSVPVCVC